MALTLNNDLTKLKVGDYVWCKYTASSGVVGTFSDLATKNDTDVSGLEIPTSSSATPDGYFKYIKVDEDHLGRSIMIADRNIQHSISWDTLNSEGIASGSGLPDMIPKTNDWRYTTRLLTGGVDSSDTDNEWDKYIVNSDLGGLITAGDDNVWNWSGDGSLFTWTSTTSSTSSNRVLRGGTAVTAFYNTVSSDNKTADRGFRPVLEIETLFTLLNKTLIQFSSGECKKIGVVSTKTEYMDSEDNLITPMTSNTTPVGIADQSSFTDSNYQAWKAFDGVYGDSNSSTSYWIASTTVNEWISYEFLSPYIVNRYGMITQPSSSYGYVSRMPKDWTFEGWDGSQWVVLDAQSGVTDWVDDTMRYFDINNNTSYKKYRLFISANNGGAYLSLGEFEMYGLYPIEEDVYGWQTVSTTLPTLQQFKDEGMDDLTIFDRELTTFTQDMNDDGVFGSGNKFSTTIDLDKYFDIKSIKKI